MQTLAIFVIAVAALGALAARLGTDGRTGAWSREQEYAAQGFRWGDRTPERRASSTSNRRRLAPVLLLAMVLAVLRKTGLHKTVRVRRRASPPW